MDGLMSYKGYIAKIEYDSEGEVFFGRLLGIKDRVSFDAETVDGLKKEFHDTVDDYLETCRQLGKSPDKPYSGNVMLRVDPTVHSKAARAAEGAGLSLNQWGERALKKAAEEQLS